MWVTSAVYTDKRPGDNMYLLATIYGYSVYIIVRHIVTYKGKITKKKNFITQWHYYEQIPTFFSYLLKCTDI